MLSMSAKSNLGKRNDFKHSQPIGVEFIDYSLTLGNFRKETDVQVAEVNVKEMTDETMYGASSREIMNPSSVPSIRVDDYSEVLSKKKKYRRSMLGQRTKLYNLDSTLTVSKTLHYDENEAGQTNKIDLKTPLAKQNVNNYLSNETPSGITMMKNPLYTSSPNSESHRPSTPPNPFGYEESVSKFFESEINDMGAWSVFKTKQDGIKSPSVCSTGGKSLKKSSKPVAEVPDKTPVRKHFKTKLFQLDKDSVVSDKRNEERLQKTSIGTSALDIKDKKYKSWHSTHQSISRSKPKSPEFNPIDDEIIRDLDSDAPTSDVDNLDLSNKCVENNFTWSVQNNDDENSDDSFSIAESTIIDSAMLTATKQRSASKAPKLSIICEEDVKISEKCDKFPDLSDSLDKSSVDSDEQVFNYLSESFKRNLEQLYKLNEKVKVHSVAADKMLESFLKEKNIRDNYVKQFQKKLDEFNLKYYENNPDKIAKTFINTNGINKEQRKKKRVISSKVKHTSPALMRTPENAFTSPITSKSPKRKQSQILKSYSELRKGFSYLKTPEQTKEKKKPSRSSICYTPKSLSICINEQLKSLDS